MDARRLKIALVVGGALLALTVVGVIFWLLDLNRYKGSIETLVRDNIGRELRIEGDLRLGLGFVPTATAREITVANAAWSSEPHMARVGRLELEVRLLPLLRGRVEVFRLILRDTQLLLETDAQGRHNWELALAEPEATADPGADEAEGEMQFALREIDLENLEVRYRDAGTGTERHASIDSLVVGEERNERVPVELQARVDGHPIRIGGRISDLEVLLRNEPYFFDLALEIGAARAKLIGSLTEPLEGRGMELVASGTTPSLRELSPLGRLPETEALRFEARVAEVDGVYRFDPLDLELGDSHLAGSCGFDASRERPSLTGTLRSDRIDLSWLGPRKASASEPDAALADTRIFPDDPLPIEALRAVDVDVTLDVADLRVRAGRYRNLRLPVKLSAGLLRIGPFAVDATQGRLAGDLVVDARPTSPRFSMKLSGDELLLSSLLDELAGIDVGSGGPTRLRVRLDGTGRSVRSLMASLTGRFDASIGEGRLRSNTLDVIGASLLSRIVRVADPDYRADEFTDIRCGVLGLQLRDGVATTRREVAVETPKTRVVVSGQIDLRDETLALAIRPDAQRGVGAGELAKLVYLGGTLAEPRLEVDVKGAALQAARLGAAFATWGGSLLVQEALEDRHPCETALQRAAVARGEVAPEPRPIRDATKSVGDSIGDLFAPR